MDGPAAGVHAVLAGTHEDHWRERPAPAHLGAAPVHVQRAVLQPHGHRQQGRAHLHRARRRGAVQPPHAGRAVLLDESPEVSV